MQYVWIIQMHGYNEIIRKDNINYVTSSVTVLKRNLTVYLQCNALSLTCFSVNQYCLNPQPSDLLFLTVFVAFRSLTCWWSCSRMSWKLPAPLVRSLGLEAEPVSASNQTRAGKQAARSIRRLSAARLIYLLYELMQFYYACTTSVNIYTLKVLSNPLHIGKHHNVRETQLIIL